jgi:hypothetical protein
MPGVIESKKQESKMREVRKRLSKSHDIKFDTFKIWHGIFEELDMDDFKDACKDAGITNPYVITSKYNYANELHLKKQRYEKWCWCKLTDERCYFKLPCESADGKGNFLCPVRRKIVEGARRKILMQQVMNQNMKSVMKPPGAYRAG